MEVPSCNSMTRYFSSIRTNSSGAVVLPCVTSKLDTLPEEVRSVSFLFPKGRRTLTPVTLGCQRNHTLSVHAACLLEVVLLEHHRQAQSAASQDS